MKNLILRTITSIFIILPFLATLIFASSFIFSTLLLIILIIILFKEWPKITPFKSNFNYIFTTIYIILPFTFLIYFSLSDQSYYNMLIFTLTFTFDTGSYIFGKLFGKHRISAISPGKTLEGAIGGFITTLFASLIFFPKSSVSFLILFNLFFSTFALFGDLFESYLKRKAKIKDSSSILPGQGGLLDRFDSILFTTIFIFCFKIILEKLN